MIFSPALQQIKDVGTGSFVAAEVLARWCCEGQMLTPSELSSPPNWGLVDIEIARFIQDNLCHCSEEYQALFVNVSEQTLKSDIIFHSWAQIIRAITKNYPLRLVIEITEGVQDKSLAFRWSSLTAMGVNLALDDYGDKNSSMARLLSYDWNYCKFDARKLSSFQPFFIADVKASILLRNRLRHHHWKRMPNYLVWYGNKVFFMGSRLL